MAAGSDKRHDARYEAEVRQLQRAIARLRASVMGIVFGAVGGAAIFVATAWLLIRGGKVVGPHLALLGNYFPGYSVSWPGAFIGFLYGALVGAVGAWCVTWVYNLAVDLRHKP
jgi:hypothetical protein